MSLFGIFFTCLLSLSEPIFLINNPSKIGSDNYLCFNEYSNKEEQKEQILYNTSFEKQFLIKYDKKSCVVIDLKTGSEIYKNNSFVYPYKEDNYYHIFIRMLF